MFSLHARTHALGMTIYMHCAHKRNTHHERFAGVDGDLLDPASFEAHLALQRVQTRKRVRQPTQPPCPCKRVYLATESTSMQGIVEHTSVPGAGSKTQVRARSCRLMGMVSSLRSSNSTVTDSVNVSIAGGQVRMGRLPPTQWAKLGSPRQTGRNNTRRGAYH